MKHSWKRRSALIGAAAILIVCAAVYVRSRIAPSEISASLVALDTPAAGFQRADGPIEFSFPEDYGPHPNFQTEWWYTTGNLETAQGRHFGYQLTFFRRSLSPASAIETRESGWASSQVFLAHLALTDVDGTQFTSHERWERGAAGLAGAAGDPLFQVWLADWSVTQVSQNEYHLTAKQGDINLDFTLVDEKGPILEGDEGYSRKGAEPGNASYYFSQTHLSTTGVITLGGEEYEVTGLSWMDHEYSTSALSSGQVGWDWFSVQLDTDTELMLFQIRRSDGQIDTYSAGTVVYSDASKQNLAAADFKITPLDTWKSPRSGAVYPSGWRLEIPALEVSLDLRPYLKDQENTLTFTYWEGAVSATGAMGGKPVTGSGYVELTGYAGSMAGQF